KLWNTETGAPEPTLPTGAAQPWALAFSPDGKILVVGGTKDDRTFTTRKETSLVTGQVQFWDAQTWTVKHLVELEQYVNTVAFSADGQTLASVSQDQTLRLWNMPVHAGDRK